MLVCLLCISTPSAPNYPCELPADCTALLLTLLLPVQAILPLCNPLCHPPLHPLLSPLSTSKCIEANQLHALCKQYMCIMLIPGTASQTQKRGVHDLYSCEMVAALAPMCTHTIRSIPSSMSPKPKLTLQHSEGKFQCCPRRFICKQVKGLDHFCPLLT